MKNAITFNLFLLFTILFSAVMVQGWTGKCTGGYTVGACVKVNGKVGQSDKHTGYGGTTDCYSLSESECKSKFCGICRSAGAKCICF